MGSPQSIKTGYKKNYFVSINNYLEQDCKNSTMYMFGTKYKKGNVTMAGSVGYNGYTDGERNPNTNKLLYKNRVVTEGKVTYTQPLTEIKDRQLSIAFQARGRVMAGLDKESTGAWQVRGTTSLIYGDSKGNAYVTGYAAHSNSGPSLGIFYGLEVALGKGWSIGIEPQYNYSKRNGEWKSSWEANLLLNKNFSTAKKEKPKSFFGEY